MFDFIQNFIFNSAIYVVVFGFLLGVGASIMPSALVQYKIPVVIVGIVLCLFGTFQLGKKNERELNTAKQVQEQLKTQETLVQSEKINTNTVIEYQDKIKYVDRIKEIPIEVYVSKANDEKCSIDTATANNIRMLIGASHQGRLPTTTPNPPSASRKPD